MPRRSDVLAGPAFGPLSKGGLREAVGDRDFYDPSASLRSAAPFIQRETSQEDVPGEGTGRIPALHRRGDPRGRLSRRAPASFAPVCALGRLSLQFLQAFQFAAAQEVLYPAQVLLHLSVAELVELVHQAFQEVTVVGNDN